MMMETELCSSRVLSLPRYDSGDEELSVLPRHTKVIVTGNNRTKSVLVGLQGVVKKAVGLGGWHWLVLKNGVEVKLQRNALSVLEPPTGNEDDDDIDGNNSFCSSSDMGDKDMDYSIIEYRKPTKPRVRHTRPWSSCTKSSNRDNFHPSSILQTVSMNPDPSKEQLFHGVQQHFQSQFVVLTSGSNLLQMLNKKQQQLDELQVILGFIQAAKRLKTLYHS
uniref:Histone deacetylase complex subunit SAP30 Sin3 binding domain-containing protein n=1 Tax=Oryza glumipatula TaxID=40148 RepID=A0A0D9Z0D0_9ORYZ